MGLCGQVEELGEASLASGDLDGGMTGNSGEERKGQEGHHAQMYTFISLKKCLLTKQL